MILIAMAHYGEAQVFLDKVLPGRMHFEPYSNGGAISPPVRLNLFKNKYAAEYLVITGEGRENAILATSAAIHAIQEDCRYVIHLGVCGYAGDSEKDYNAMQEEVICLKTIYAADLVCSGNSTQSNAKFQTFQTDVDFDHKNSGTIFNIPKAMLPGKDIVSTNQRVTDKGVAQHLRRYADLIDMESWGAAKVCQFQGISYLGFRIISDAADSTHICASVKENAYLYSKKLHDFYLQCLPMSHIEEPNDTATAKNLGESYLLGASGETFHVTVQQEVALQKLSKIYQLTTESSVQQTAWHELINAFEEKCTGTDAPLAPKKKTKELIAFLEEKITPLLARKRREALEIISLAQSKAIKFSIDRNLHSSKIKFSGELKECEDISQAIQSLENLDLVRFQNLLESGGIH